MKVIFLVILLVGISAVLVGGVLQNNLSISTANISVLDDSEITIKECTCKDPDNPGNSGPEFCDPEIFEGTICETTQQITPESNTFIDDVSLAPSESNTFIEDVSLAPSESVKFEGMIFEEGCNANFWRELQNDEITQTQFWPPNYAPEFHFNDIFLANLDNSYFLISYAESNNSVNQITRGNLLDKLEILKTQYAEDPSTIEKIDSAINSVQNSLNPEIWFDDLHLNPNEGKQFFEEDANAIFKLVSIIQTQEIAIQHSSEENKLIEEEKLQSLQKIVSDIIDSERILVGNSLEDAHVYVKDSNELALASDKFNAAKEQTQLKEPIEALNFYKNSWIHSQNALGLNAGDSYGPTLLEVLSEKPKHHSNTIGQHDLAKQSMVALLNSEHRDISFSYQSEMILTMTQSSFMGDNGALIDIFEEENNRHSSDVCP